MTQMINFYYIDKQKKRVEFEIDSRDVKDFKIHILEASQIANIGDIYMYDTLQKEWIVLDYYNDV